MVEVNADYGVANDDANDSSKDFLDLPDSGGEAPKTDEAKARLALRRTLEIESGTKKILEELAGEEDGKQKNGDGDLGENPELSDDLLKKLKPLQPDALVEIDKKNGLAVADIVRSVAFSPELHLEGRTLEKAKNIVAILEGNLTPEELSLNYTAGEIKAALGVQELARQAYDNRFNIEAESNRDLNR